MGYINIGHMLKNILENRALMTAMIKTTLEPESCSFLTIFFLLNHDFCQFSRYLKRLSAAGQTDTPFCFTVDIKVCL